MNKLSWITVIVAIILIPLLLVAVTPTAQAATTVWINEIHYDNAGTDTGEAIEIAGPAGTDLTGWSIVLYNGNGGAVYDTDSLSGVIPDQENGFGTVFISYPTNGIQNGSPDGIALVDDGGTVVQFLSYEGTFTAVGGPADGMTSTDIGVSEPSDSPVGFSLQLIGTGTMYEDFTWSGPAADSFGAVNSDQTFGEGGPTSTPTATTVPPPPALLVINEVDYDQPSTDTAEFIELRNNDSAPVNLDSYSIELVNGSNNTVYDTIDLPDVELASGDYYVICGDASTTPECDLDVSPDSNLIQNGAPDAVALVLNGQIVDALSYEGDVAGYTEGTGATGDSTSVAFVGLSRYPDGTDSNNNSADFSLRCITPGEANTDASTDCPAPGGGGGGEEQCGDPATLIHDIQGSGDASPLEGQTVTIEGIVVGDFQDDGVADSADGQVFFDLGGFYVQEEPGDADGLDETSEGIFVFAPGATDVRAGDVVRLTGTVDEFNGLTEIPFPSALTVCGTAPLPDPTDVFLPVASDDALERYEGMLVEFPQDLVISEYFNFDRFGEIVLAEPMLGEDRLYQPTAVEEPGSLEAAARAAYNELSRITLDDGRSEQNPDPARHPNGAEFTLDNRFRGGDLVTDAVGVLDYRFGLYRIQPTDGADYTSVNPRDETPDPVGGTLTVASFNVLNYFLTLDNSGSICGPDMNQDCRGADNQEEFERQRAKIIAALAAINADVYGLIEMENTTGVEPLADIVAGLNAELGAGTYDYIDTGTIGSDAIKVGIIYKPSTVTPVGDYAILDSSVDPRFNDDKNRPVLAQSFREDATGAVFTVAVNHLKSKGSPCDDVGDPDTGDGQGNCNLTRLAAAEALVDWLATDPTGSGDPDFLIIGDLNSYDKEDPIDAILEGADDTLGTGDDYVDLVRLFEGELAYSYVFDGQFGYLDYALANLSLASQVAGVTTWHINADEPDILDYDTTFKQDAQDALYEPNAFRSSDHDPVIVGLELEPNAAPSCDAGQPSVASLWPPNHRFVPVSVLDVTDPDGDPVTLTIDSIFQDEPVSGPGSGDTQPDGRILSGDTVEVRAERSGRGDGRVYHIAFTAVDGNGGSCAGEVLVEVPHNRRRPAVDGGALYDSTLP